MDLKGTILLLDGRAEEAIPYLEEACALGRDPRFLLHLGAACKRLGRTEEAVSALRKAAEGQLENRALTESETQMLAELEDLAGQIPHPGGQRD
jgi:Flp pilus assembly protein TadD